MPTMPRAPATGRLPLVLGVCAWMGLRVVVEAFPEMAGSCGRPGGIHLPNEAETGGGGFSVGLGSIQNDGNTKTATVTLAHESKSNIEGLLLRAIDADSHAELGDFTGLAGGTMLYEGCTRTTAAVCQERRKDGRGGRRRLGDDDEDDGHVELPATMTLSWPATKQIRVMFWAVDDKHEYYLAQDSSDQGPTIDEITLPMICTHPALPTTPMATSLGGLAAVSVIGSLRQLRTSAFIRKMVPHKHVIVFLGSNYGLGGWSYGEILAGIVFLLAQAAAGYQAWLAIPGFPMQATSARVAGMLSASGMSMVMLPVSRFSLWPKLLGLPYERAVIWHRALGTWTLGVTGWHAGVMINDVGLEQLLMPSQFQTPNNCFGMGNLYGSLAGIAGALLLLLSLGPVRRLSYRTFHVAHLVLVPLLLIAACLHISDLIYWLLPAVVAELTFNLGSRMLAQRKSSTPRLVSSRTFCPQGEQPDGRQHIPVGVVELRLYAPLIVNAVAKKGADGFGSWVFLSKSKGFGELVDPHPFSIAGFGPTGTGELKLLIKAMPGTNPLKDPTSQDHTWTQELLRSVGGADSADAEQQGDTGMDGALSADCSKPAPLSFKLDGPQGRPGYDLAKATTLVLVGGGIGVTPLLPIMECASSGAAHPLSGSLPALRRVIFVWTVRDRTEFEWAQDVLTSCAPTAQLSSSSAEAAAPGHGAPVIDVRLHCTRGGEGWAAGHAIAIGRPDVRSVLQQAVNDDQLDREGASEVVAFACGPGQMIQGVRESGQELGVPVHHETFEM